jgi:hypothetical protein
VSWLKQIVLNAGIRIADSMTVVDHGTEPGGLAAGLGNLLGNK